MFCLIDIQVKSGQVTDLYLRITFYTVQKTYYITTTKYQLLLTIILAVDRRSRISTSFFTSGRSDQYLWSSN